MHTHAVCGSQWLPLAPIDSHRVSLLPNHYLKQQAGPSMYESVFTSLRYKRENVSLTEHLIYSEGSEVRKATDDEVAESERREKERYERDLMRVCGASSTAASAMYLGTATALGFDGGSAAAAAAGDGTGGGSDPGAAAVDGSAQEELAEAWWE